MGLRKEHHQRLKALRRGVGVCSFEERLSVFMNSVLCQRSISLLLVRTSTPQGMVHVDVK